MRINKKTARGKNALLVVGTNTFFFHQHALAKLLINHEIRPVLLFDINYPNVREHIDLCKNEKIPYEEFFTVENELKETRFLIFMSQFILFCKRVDYKITGGFFWELIRSIRILYAIDSVLRKWNIGLAILVSDLVQYDTGLYIKACKYINAKVMIMPLFAADFKEAAEHYYSNPKYEISFRRYSLINKIKFLRKWVIAFKSKFMIRLPLSTIAVRQLMGNAPKFPWAINGGRFDIMAVEGDAVKRLFMKSIPGSPDKILVTGSLSTDKIYYHQADLARKKSEFYRDYDLDPSKSSVLVAIPPDMFSSRGTQSEYSDYNEMISFWITNISSKLKDYNVIYTIHPSVEPSSYESFHDLGCQTIKGHTIDFIAFFDIYIASVSATIQWAILCGIPVINYDVYRYNYDDYKGVDGVIYAEAREEFASLLDWIAQPGNVNNLTEIQKNSASDWGKLDGLSAQRIISAINQLML